MTRRIHAHSTTTVTLDERARLVLRCAQDPPGEEADLTDRLALLVHTGKRAAAAHPTSSPSREDANLVDFGELRLDAHGHVLLDGRRTRARDVLDLAAAGLTVVVEDCAREWRVRAAAFEESLEGTGDNVVQPGV